RRSSKTGPYTHLLWVSKCDGGSLLPVVRGFPHLGDTPSNQSVSGSVQFASWLLLCVQIFAPPSSSRELSSWLPISFSRRAASVRVLLPRKRYPGLVLPSDR